MGKRLEVVAVLTPSIDVIGAIRVNARFEPPGGQGEQGASQAPPLSPAVRRSDSNFMFGADYENSLV